MSKGLRALLAWPLGVILAMLWLFVSIRSMIPDDCKTPPPGETDFLSTCAVAPMPWSLILVTLCLTFGPGVLATWLWLRSRRRAST